MNRQHPIATSRLRILCNTVLAWANYGKLRVLCVIGRKRPPAVGPPHLLVLAWLFPPTISGGVYRPLSFVRHVAAKGWRVTVVAGPTEQDPTEAGLYLSAQLPASVNVLRLPAHQEPVSHRGFPRIDGGFQRILQTVELVRSSGDLWPDVVLASGPPFHNFAAGWMVSRMVRAPLVLDYRDEWTECPFGFVQVGNADLTWERRCLRSAAAVLMTSDSFIQHARSAFPELPASKVHKVMNGWEPGDTPPLQTNDQQRTCELVYMGLLGDHTPIEKLLADWAALHADADPSVPNMVLRFVGQRAAHARRQLAAFPDATLLRLDKQVSKPQAVSIMRHAAALLLINPPALTRYIPGKLFDYIAAGTPILVYGDGGECAAIVRELGAGVVVPPGDIAALRRAVTALAMGQVSTDPVKAHAWLASHTRARAAEQLMGLLDTAVRHSRTPP